MNAEMNAMIDQAERENKWLWCGYQDLWFSPAELRKSQSEGRFRWGPVNWKLRDLAEKALEINSRINSLVEERERLAARLRGGQ